MSVETADNQAVCTYDAVIYTTNELLIEMTQDSINSTALLHDVFIWLAVAWGIVALVLLYKSLPNKSKEAGFFKINIIGAGTAAIIALVYGASILGDLIEDQKKLVASTKVEQRKLGEPSDEIRAACEDKKFSNYQPNQNSTTK